LLERHCGTLAHASAYSGVSRVGVLGSGGEDDSSDEVEDGVVFAD
jgi:hypothetical protein